MSHASTAPPPPPARRRLPKPALGWLAIAAITALAVLLGHLIADRTTRATIDVPAIQSQVADLLTRTNIRDLINALRSIVGEPLAFPFNTLVLTSTLAAIAIGAWMGYRPQTHIPPGLRRLTWLVIKFIILTAGAYLALGFATIPAALQTYYVSSPVEAVRQQLPPQPTPPGRPDLRPSWAQIPISEPITIQHALDHLATGQRDLTIFLAFTIPFAAFITWGISHALFHGLEPPTPPKPPASPPLPSR